jgi:hypothetical protein
MEQAFPNDGIQANKQMLCVAPTRNKLRKRIANYIIFRGIRWRFDSNALPSLTFINVANLHTRHH